MKEEGGYNSGSLLLSFILGGVVGAGLAFLLAPQSGRETRQKIKDWAEDIKDRTTDYIEETRDKATSAVEKGKDFLEEKKSVIATAIEAGKEAYEREKNRHAK